MAQSFLGRRKWEFSPRESKQSYFRNTRLFILRYFCRFKEQQFREVKKAPQDFLSHIFLNDFFFEKITMVILK